MKYRLNDDTDYHDPARPFTTYCPFLPGQPINILDVPIQSSQSNGSNDGVPASSDSSAVFTMNPEDKFLTPRPVLAQIESELSQSQSPTTIGPTPRASGLIKPSSFPAKKGSSITRPASAPGSFQTMSDDWSDTKEMTRSCSLYSLVRSHKGRDLQSAGQTCSHRLPPKVLIKRRPKLWINPNIPFLRSNAEPQSSCSARSSALNVTQPKPLVIRQQKSNRSVNAALRSPSISVSIPAHVQQVGRSITSNCPPSSSRSNDQPSEYARDNARSAPATPLAPNKATLLESFQKPSALGQTIPGNSRAESSKVTNFTRPADLSYDMHDAMFQGYRLRRASFPEHPSTQRRKRPDQDIQNTHHASSPVESTYNGGYTFTPSLTVSTIDTGLMSPFRLHDPDAASPNDLRQLSDGLASPRNNLDLSSLYHETDGLQGYVCPMETRKPTLTLRSTPLTNDEQGAGGFLQQESKIRVQAWNDGSGQGTLDMDETFDDLSYLGAMIV